VLQAFRFEPSMALHPIGILASLTASPFFYVRPLRKTSDAPQPAHQVSRLG
jgi:hypothetical protein